ncbi:hypothetical protein AEAC466_15010 [Asticcacaulis sp. AC466]|uniref:hypothetical protein n=1 Tax=Asticcacaulis sp. AC466 TaxID=1282362 RepID=UPI0003C3B07B|nr:hypothetical protein [Asticcacaulis sp. AC466]ESQ83169.1 hypothetical protein AEAC466_15010 [Asticcacaulis sp. AC466]
MLRARAVHPKDESQRHRLLAFIKAEARGGLFPRPANILDNAIQSGQAIYIEDGEAIVAGALMFDYTGNRCHYYEIGTHLVARSHEGRGFQVALTRLQIAQACLDLEDIEASPIFAIMENNSPSLHNAVNHARFKIWELPDELRSLRDRTGVRSSAEKLVCNADDEAIQAAFSALRVSVSGGVLKTHKDETPIHLDFPWLDYLLQAGPY